MMEALGGAAIAMVIFYGGHQVISGTRTPGAFFSFITALLLAYQPVKKIPIVNVLGEISEEPSPGYVEFRMAGRTLRLDPIDEGDGELFFIFRDGTSGKTTYPPGRFLVATKTTDGKVVMDFNKAYNPPCAFSEFTTCPLPQRQNHLKVPMAAGELVYKKTLAIQ